MGPSFHPQMGHGIGWSRGNGLLDFSRLVGPFSLGSLPGAPSMPWVLCWVLCPAPSSHCDADSALPGTPLSLLSQALHCSPPTWSLAPGRWTSDQADIVKPEKSCDEGHRGSFTQPWGARAGS